jgi:hypothetical protein
VVMVCLITSHTLCVNAWSMPTKVTSTPLESNASLPMHVSSPSPSRRRVVASALSIFSLASADCLFWNSNGIGMDKVAYAVEPSSERRPYAPIEALIPATQQRILLSKAMETVQRLRADPSSCQAVSSDSATSAPLPCIDSLRQYFAPPQPSLAKRAAISMTKRYQDDRQVLQDLERKQSSFTLLLSGKAIRAACNVYTANLRFGESYLLTASPSDKSRLIRTYSQLPDVKQVITADLDLRDLYRNQIQTLIEDAQAEVYRDEPDLDELSDILKEASGYLDQWYGLIDPVDVQKATELVQDTGNRGKVDLPNQRFGGYNFFS